MSRIRPAQDPPPGITLRPARGAGDVETIVRRHVALYATEQGWDATFEEYVRVPLEAALDGAGARECVWVAEHEGRFAGSVAIVAGEGEAARLRWFLVEPALRGRGLGSYLLAQAVAFASRSGYRRVDLWTVQSLGAARRLYRAAGFEPVEAHAGTLGGQPVIEERHALELS